MIDYVVVEDNKGELTKMEAVLSFQLKEFHNQYLIYRSLDKKEYYVARCHGNRFDTHLSVSEQVVANEILKEVVENGSK